MNEIQTKLNSLADQNLLPHGLLLSGQESEVLKLTALGLAGRLLGTARPEIHPDFIHINSHQVEDIRRLLGVLSLRSFGNRVVVLENAEELTAQAVNNMLKKIEEPSEKTTFIVLTGHEEKLLPTLRSRLMSFSFGSHSSAVEEIGLAKEFLDKELLEQKLKLVKEIDPHEQDLNLFLKQIYQNEINNLGEKSGQRLKAILRTFELLAANVQANRALAWLSLKWN